MWAEFFSPNAAPSQAQGVGVGGRREWEGVLGWFPGEKSLEIGIFHAKDLGGVMKNAQQREKILWGVVFLVLEAFLKKSRKQRPHRDRW